MSFLDKMTAFLPLGKKEQDLEYFFAVNIGAEKITAALWIIDGKELKILDVASENYSSDEIISVTDKLLDQVLGLKEIEPQKILFGVPHSWILDDNLKEEYLKLLRKLIKELELVPMAYVATSLALINLLEKQEGVPTTAILVGFEERHLTVIVVRAGKLDGAKVVARGESAGADIEKVLLTFTDVETLPSKILIYGPQSEKLKNQLLSFSWMNKLSFLHFPKIDILSDDVEIQSVCLAGGSEINSDIKLTDIPQEKLPLVVEDKVEDFKPEKLSSAEETSEDKEDNFGFVAGDISREPPVTKEDNFVPVESEKELVVPEEQSLEFAPPMPEVRKRNFKKVLPKSFLTLSLIVALLGILGLFAGFYLFVAKADVKVFVEPKVLEKDAQVVADPNQKTVDEEGKIIPAQIVDVEVAGLAKESATGKRQIGDSAKGTVVIINNTSAGQNFSAGTTLSSAGGLKFKLDNTASVSATLVDSDSKSKVTVSVTATDIGADGNIPSETNLIVGNYPSSQFVAKAQGNFAGGNSKNVTVVTSEDQQRLLAKLSSNLRQQAQQKLQEKYPDKKILEEALSESIAKKSYSKNINDQANEFSMNMTARFKGTAFDDKDLKTIVSKLVTTQVPDGFLLDLSATETQADVAKLEKDGRLIFLARFKAKLIPKIDTDQIKNQIRFKTPSEVSDLLKSMENILGAEVKLTPNLPAPLNRLPLSENIKVEVGLK